MTDQWDAYRNKTLVGGQRPDEPGDVEDAILQPSQPLSNDQLGQFNQHIMLTVQAVQQLNTALKTTRFL